MTSYGHLPHQCIIRIKYALYHHISHKYYPFAYLEYAEIHILTHSGYTFLWLTISALSLTPSLLSYTVYLSSHFRSLGWSFFGSSQADFFFYFSRNSESGAVRISNFVIIHNFGKLKPAYSIRIQRRGHLLNAIAHLPLLVLTLGVVPNIQTLYNVL